MNTDTEMHPIRPFPVTIMIISLAVSLVLIILSSYAIQTAWSRSAFGDQTQNGGT